MKKNGPDNLQVLADPKILFEDDHFLVLNKPAGLVVNRAETVREKTLQDWLEEKGNWPLAKNKGLRSGIVHRLDKETSGLLLVAKTKRNLIILQDQFKARQVKKKYLALVYGRLAPKRGEIALPVARHQRNRQKFGVVADGKKSQTQYQVIKYCQKQDRDYSYLELTPKTGRTHQLRVHLSFLGYPMVADLKYGGKQAKKDRLWCPRMFLHAFYLSFSHPETGQKVEFSSPLPQELENAILY